MSQNNLAFSIVLMLVLVMPLTSRANMAPPVGYRLGMTVEKTGQGPRIKAINKDSEAARSGLQVGDIILGVDGRYAKMFSDSDLKAFTDDLHSWPMKLTIARGDEVLSLRVPS